MAAIDWKNWREKNKTRLAAVEKERHKNPDRKKYMRDYLKEYYQRNREKMIAAATANYVANKSEKLRYHKAHRLKNLDKIKDQKKKAYHANLGASREKARLYGLERYKEKREQILASHKAWRDKNAPKVRAQTFARASRRKNLEKLAEKNLEQLKRYVREVRAKPSFVCYYCEKRFPIHKLHFDHVIALTKGGSHSADNLCTACQSCNCSKNDKLLADWIKGGQQVFPI